MFGSGGSGMPCIYRTLPNPPPIFFGLLAPDEPLRAPCGKWGNNNPNPGRQSIQIRRHPLTERSFLEH